MTGRILLALGLSLTLIQPACGGRQQNIVPGEPAARSDSLESRLRQTPVTELVTRVMTGGEAKRGALLYYNPVMTCIKCHEPLADARQLGPVIADVNRESTVEFLIESLLDPSRQITEGFHTQTIVTVDGRQFTGLVTQEPETANEHLVISDPARDGQQTRVLLADIEERRDNQKSAMPDGLIGALNDEQSFLDLIRYLLAIKQGGQRAVLQLRPPDSFFAIEPLPEYESDIDHAGMIAALNDESFQRGALIYKRYCARCHGTRDQAGSMPSARLFFESEFKNGNDPLAMYRTLTHGYGLMVPQRWMVPQQKYDVIHYIREQFVRGTNIDQYFSVDDKYLGSLPRGTSRGPDPVVRTPWSDMDYGNFLFNTLEVGDDGSNIAYKGIAVRLDAGPGGVSQGRHWILYEHDTMRVAAAWSGQGFIDYQGIHFDDQHNVHPRIIGDILLANDHRPGWADPRTGSMASDNDPRFVGRDNRRYGPLPAEWLKYRGLYQYDNRAVLNYTVGETPVLESPSLEYADDQPVFVRTLDIGPRNQPLLVRVLSTRGLHQLATSPPNTVLLTAADETTASSDGGRGRFRFDGEHYLAASSTLDWRSELTILARVRTTDGGTIVCQTANQPKWVPGGTSLFVRQGRLVFDIGWVGAVTSQSRIDDGQWHTLGLIWKPDKGSVELFVDGRLDQSGELEPGQRYEQPELRVGYTSSNFPEPRSVLVGEISNLKIWNRSLAVDEIADFGAGVSGPEPGSRPPSGLIVDWQFEPTGAENERVVDRSPIRNDANWRSIESAGRPMANNTWVRANGVGKANWHFADESLWLEIPAGEQPISIAIAAGTANDPASMQAAAIEFGARLENVADLSPLTRGGPAPFPDTLTSSVETLVPGDVQPFVVEALSHPVDNPWGCRLRLTGLDFLDAQTMVACTWDGSVWRIGGLSAGSEPTWNRIASGLFQPLGIRVLGNRILVTCRDQIVELEDLNGDGSTDFYRAFNSDHQVTEHFHEFAMGLQTDAAGNLYYAKSARHALPALVAHHGTLLKVAADGSSTEILATGFRAANGVCLNPDGSFFVTDQEGHWNPKNRINWVKPGGFYGNMLGYHDITDASDEAMQQPLCWITNEFDRSPGELLWVPPDQWGPLAGSLLNLSYGMGQIFVVPREQVELNGQPQLQGGMCALPIPLFPTGIMRGRFHSDGDLYCCGMYAWAGNQQQPGGLYRIRYTGKPAWLPTTINTSPGNISIRFSESLDRESVPELDRYAIRIWKIRRSSDYGSPHLDERELEIAGVRLEADGKTITIAVPELQPTRCMEIKCRIRTAEGSDVTRTIHNTIHVVRE